MPSNLELCPESLRAMLQYIEHALLRVNFCHTSSKRESSLSDNLRDSFSNVIAELLRLLKRVSPSPDKTIVRPCYTTMEAILISTDLKDIVECSGDKLV